MDIFSVFFIIMAIFIAVMGFFVIVFWAKGFKIWRNSLKIILFHDSENNETDNRENTDNHGKKKTRSSIAGIIITIITGFVYFLSQYIFNQYILPDVNVILGILLALFFIYSSIFCRRQSERLLLAALGFVIKKLAMYYYDYMILAYDFYTHANINLAVYYIAGILIVVNLALFILKGVKGLLHKINKETEQYESALYRYIAKAVNDYKNGGFQYKTWQSNEEKARESGKEGEANVRYHLKWLDGYKVLNNVRLPNPLEPQEFDHIVIGPNGVFHLETKNYGGEYGAKIIINKEGDWSISQNGYSRGIENPLFQVRRHEKVLKEFLGKEFPQMNIPIKEIVVLSNEKTILEGQENSPITVLKVERLNDFIMGYKADTTIDEKMMELIYDKIVRYSKEPLNSKGV